MSCRAELTAYVLMNYILVLVSRRCAVRGVAVLEFVHGLHGSYSSPTSKCLRPTGWLACSVEEDRSFLVKDCLNVRQSPTVNVVISSRSPHSSFSTSIMPDTLAAIMGGLTVTPES